MEEENKDIIQQQSISEGTNDIEDIQENDSQEDTKEKPKDRREIDLIDVLKLVSPGAALRNALNDILKSGEGALIVFDSPGLQEISEGGFRINCGFTHQRLTELSKMDGAVILSEDGKKILFANRLLVPDIVISSSETGTKHQAAERTAKQVNGIAIAISERRKKITIFYGDKKYVLRDSQELLRRATETLQILEKQREIYDELITNLNVLEISGLVTIGDICSVLQRTEIIMGIVDILRKDIIELGKEGNIVNMRLRELTKSIDKNKELILKDYTTLKPEKTKIILDNFTFEGLLDTSSIARIIFEKTPEQPVFPKGYRILKKTGITEEEIQSLVNSFENLEKIMSIPEESLRNILKTIDGVKRFTREISRLKEQIMVGKAV
jgi:diadenylate cyclase